ncbi:MAG: C25 family cysteine peptidase [Candidatus Neomarinimicrobiota bacterium]
MKKALVLLLVLVSFCFAGMNKSISFSNSRVSVSKAVEAEDGNNYVEVRYEGFQYLIEAGKPEIPVIYKQFIMSADEKPVDIKITNKSVTTTLITNSLLPSNGKVSTNGVKEYPHFVGPDPLVYSSSELYPYSPIEIVDDGYMAGNHIVKIAFYPVQYDAVNKSLVINNNFDYEIVTEPSSESHKRVASRKVKMQEIYDRALRKLVDNPEDITLYEEKPMLRFGKATATSTLSYYDYVIITGDDYVSSFDDFVEWKTRKGCDIGIVTIQDIYSNYTGDLTSSINDNAGKLRQYLSDAYNSGTTFALLGGDESILPYRSAHDWDDDWDGVDSWCEIPADLYFSEFDADWDADNDGIYGEVRYSTSEFQVYPEIYVGRVLASSDSEIKNWIRKVLIYEQDPGRGNPDYIEQAFLSQADQLQSGFWAQRIKDSLDVIGFTTTIWEESPSFNSLTPTSPTCTSIISHLNSNDYGFLSLMGHGSPHQITVRSPGVNNGSWYDQITTFESMSDGTGDVGGAFENLDNAGYPGIHYSISCSNCWYVSDMCGGARSFPEMYMNYGDNGGISYLGNTRYGWIPTSLLLMEDFVNLLNDGGTEHLGVLEGISKTNSSDQYLWASHDNFGCPETKMWTDVPDAFTSVSITDNTSYITVNAGEAGCNISVTAEDPDDYSLFISDAQSYSFSTTERPLFVVITKDNKLPYITMVGLGNITSNVTLSNNLAYTFANDIRVSSSGELNIKKGTTIKFAKDKELAVYGVLNIDGTEDCPVVFNSDDLDGGVGYWDGVRVYSGGEINADNLHIFNAYSGIRGEYAIMDIDSCLIENNSYGIMASNCTGSNSCTVTNSIIKGNSSYSVRYYNADGTISGNSISDARRGIYARGDVNINNNELSDFKYDAIWCASYDGNIQFNDISDCRYGVYFSSSASGDLQNWWSVHKPASSAENNIFSTPMRSCINIGSTSTPNLGTMFEIDTDVEAGWNVFCDPTSYDVTSSNSSTIKAEGNWWGSSRSISGSVDYTYQAGEIVAIFGKKKVLSKNEILFNQAYRLERDSLYLDAAEIYISLIEDNAYYDDIEYIQKSMNRMRGCYRKLDAYSELEDALISLSTKYPDTYVSAMAKSMNTAQFSLKKDFTSALNNYDAAVEEFVDLNSSEAAAYALFDKYELLEYLSTRKDNLNKSALSRALSNCKERLIDEFDGTEASELLKEMLDQRGLIQSDLPEVFELGAPYPNPFNPVITIPYSLPEESLIKINIYDISGRKVRTLLNSTQIAGNYSIRFDAINLASGVYFIKLHSSSYNAVEKIMLLK